MTSAPSRSSVSITGADDTRRGANDQRVERLPRFQAIRVVVDQPLDVGGAPECDGGRQPDARAPLDQRLRQVAMAAQRRFIQRGQSGGVERFGIGAKIQQGDE